MSASLSAATAYAGLDARVLAGSTNLSPAPRCTAILPVYADRGDPVWLPIGTEDDAQTVLNNISFDANLAGQVVRDMGPGLRAASPFIKELITARDEYWQTLISIREEWTSGNRVLTPQIAKELSVARDALRTYIRVKYPFAGKVAKAWETTTEGIEAFLGANASKLERVTAKRAVLSAEELMLSATRASALANKAMVLARLAEPAARLAGPIVIAVELPYRAYKVDIAKTDQEANEALEKLLDTTAVGIVTVVCAVGGVATAGAALLACGVAGAAAGIWGGEAAMWIYRRVQ